MGKILIMKNSIGLIISNLSGGGAQRVVSNLSFGLSSYFKLYIILHDGKRIDYPYEGQLVDLETPVGKGFLKKTAVFMKRILKLREVKRRVKPYTVVSFLESSNFINLLSGGKSRNIISVRNYKSKQSSGFLGKLFTVMIKILYGKSDLIITPTKGIKADLVKAFNLEDGRIKVINNPYNLEYINEKAGEQLTVDHEKVFDQHTILVTAGSLTKQKGHWQLIRSFKESTKTVPDLKLFILGEGELRPYLEQMVKAMGLQEDVFMPGFDENPFKFIRKSSIFVMPSLYEGFPNALVEAMACGVPVVASDCPSGAREILAPETDFKYQTAGIELAQYGVLVPVCSNNLSQEDEPLSKQEKMMSEAVIMILKDKSLYNKYKALSLVRAKHFESSTIVKQWVEMINS